MIIFSEQDFKNRLTNIINSHFTNEQELVELSKKLNVIRGTINRWRSKELSPKLEKLALLSIITNVSLDYIVFGKEIISNTNNESYNEQNYKNRLTEILQTKFKSNLQLANILQISDSTVRAWKNQISLPSVYLLAQLSSITNLSLDYVVFGKSN